MNTQLRSLWTVGVEHAFHGGACDALEFVVPPATQAALRAMRAIARELQRQLHVLVEEDGDGHPLVDATGRRLVFGLRPRSSAFVRYTGDLGLAEGEQALFDNAQDIDLIGALPRGVRVVGQRLRIAPASAQQPLSLRALSPEGLPRASVVLGQTDAAWHWDAGALSGELRVTEEDRPGHLLHEQRLFVAPGLENCWGLLQLEVGAAHLQSGHAFTLKLPATTDRLRYYVLLKPASPADFDSLAVIDQGAAAAGRSPLHFTRRLPPFGQDYLSPDLLDPGHTRQIALFEADAPLARQARGPQGIALQRSGEVLIAHLPQPGAERSDAQFIVHLSQP